MNFYSELNKAEELFCVVECQFVSMVLVLTGFCCSMQIYGDIQTTHSTLRVQEVNTLDIKSPLSTRDKVSTSDKNYRYVMPFKVLITKHIGLHTLFPHMYSTYLWGPIQEQLIYIQKLVT